MPLALNNGILKIVWSLTSSGREYATSLGFFNVNPVPAAQIALDLVDALTNTTGPSGPATAGKTVTSYRWDRVDCSFHNTGGIFDGTAAIGVTGTNGQLPPPPNACLLIRKASATGTRHGRGRMYCPPYFEGVSTISPEGSIDASHVASLQADWQQVISRFNAGTTSSTLAILPLGTAITNLTVQSLMATQRRRLR